MKWLKSGIFLVVLILTVNSAPAPFADDTLRLPKSSVPIRYDLTLTTLVHSGIEDFTGVVKINIEIKELTDVLTLHNRGLTIKSVSLKNTLTEVDYEIEYSENKEKEFVYIESLIRPLNVGEFYTIEISYEGILQRSTSGFYRSSYKINGITR